MLKTANVLLTSVGNDGSPATLAALREATDRKVFTVGVDVRDSAPGLYLADRGYLVPPRRDSGQLLKRLHDICDREKIELIYPLSTEDQNFFAAEARQFADRGIGVVVSSVSALAIANDKLRMSEFAVERGIPCPRFVPIASAKEFDRAVYEIGYPKSPIVLKLNTGTGAQGVKVVHERITARARMFDRNNFNVTYEEVKHWLANIGEWPPMHVAEYLPGHEYSIDVLCDEGSILAAVTRLRHATLYGLAVHATVVSEPDVTSVATEIVRQMKLKYVVNVQVRRAADGTPKILEINPRIPGTIGLTVAAGVNMPYLAVKMALGESFVAPTPKVGTTILRHWEAVYLGPSDLKRSP
jgi:carbamoyl-phosphate synthase large subunit